MNNRPSMDWQHDSNIDATANASVIGAGIFVTLVAAGLAATGQAPPDAQLAQQSRANRSAIAAQTTSPRNAKYGDAIQLATTSSNHAAQISAPVTRGDHHAN